MFPRLENRCELLCCSSAVTQYSTFCQQAGSTVSRHVTCVVSRGSAILEGIPTYLLDRLQLVLNAAPRLICRAR